MFQPHVTTTDSTIVIQTDSMLIDNCPHCELSEREQVSAGCDQ